MIHPTAEVSENVRIGCRTRVWHRAQICSGAQVGDECIVGSAVYIDRDVTVGNRVKIQTGAQLYHGSAIEDGVFIGPMVCLANDRHPRAITPAGGLKTDADWILGRVRIQYGASLGAGSIVLPGVSVGRFAMVAAGAVVTENVPDYGLIAGTPGRLVGYSCACGHGLTETSPAARWTCGTCGAEYLINPGRGGLHPVDSDDDPAVDHIVDPGAERGWGPDKLCAVVRSDYPEPGPRIRPAV